MDDLAISVNSIVMSDDDNLNISNSSNYSTNNIASNIHPRLDAYKKKTLYYSNQEERRQRILTEQKKKRLNLIESNRNLDVSVKKQHQSPETNNYCPKSSKKLPQLMFSEWFEEIPNDFSTNWIMVVSPVGKRCLVVASEGTTMVYNKGGKLISKHLSKLPGGNKDSKVDITILDCIYSDVLRTYFVLDCLSWKSHPITDSESEFRFYWLKCKLDESVELSESSYENPYKFRDLIRSNECSISSIQSKFENPYDFEIDGLLFYHKEAHYMPGHTPLVIWLKAYMIPEIINIPMPIWIMNLAPTDYKGYKEEINKSNLELKELKNYLNNKETNYNERNSKCQNLSKDNNIKLQFTLNDKQKQSNSVKVNTTCKSKYLNFNEENSIDFTSEE